MSMNDSVLVNQVYLIFNRPLFLVDSNDRLMVFNYLIENKDDHAKNFAFIYRDGEWHFSPAYDLLPSDGMNGFHTTSINDSIEPTKDDLLAVAVKAGLNKKEAESIYIEIEKKIRKFRK